MKSISTQFHIPSEISPEFEKELKQFASLKNAPAYYNREKSVMIWSVGLNYDSNKMELWGIPEDGGMFSKEIRSISRDKSHYYITCKDLVRYKCDSDKHGSSMAMYMDCFIHEGTQIHLNTVLQLVG